MPIIDADRLKNWSCRILVAAGTPEGEATIVSSSLVESNLRGHDSHGVIRLPQYLDLLRRGEYQCGMELLVERESPAAFACDAQWGFGQVQAHKLLGLLERRLGQTGVVAGTARNCGHIGRLGEYAELACAAGNILIASVNNDGAGQRVAPPGGTEPRLGTNPLCIGVPSLGDPIILDFGTSVVAEGKVRTHYLDGKRAVPDGWLLGADGRPTTDSAVLYEPPLGSILPMGGAQSYKGFGLALVLDLLTGGLSGGRVAHSGAPPAKGNCVLFVLIDPECLGGRDAMVSAASQLAAYVRETPTSPGAAAILLPGDPERRTRAQRLERGVPLPENHWKRLVELSSQLGVDAPLANLQ